MPKLKRKNKNPSNNIREGAKERGIYTRGIYNCGVKWGKVEGQKEKFFILKGDYTYNIHYTHIIMV